MNSSSQQFDVQLNEIVHYQRFPCMKPYIGRLYGNGGGKKILLIGESHYLPASSTISADAKKWYSLDYRDLSDKEIGWINTREILSGNWAPDGHQIFRELNLRMSQFFNNQGARAMTNVAFMNAFQRPSPNTKDSIKYTCKSIDIEVASRTIKEVIKIIKPEVVLFVSKFSWDRLHALIAFKEYGITSDFVCHPGTGGRYWHKSTYKHGMTKFVNLISASVSG